MMTHVTEDWLLRTAFVVSSLLLVFEPTDALLVSVQLIDVAFVASVVPSGNFACGRNVILIFDCGVFPKFWTVTLVPEVIVTFHPWPPSLAEQDVDPAVAAFGYVCTQPV